MAELEVVVVGGPDLGIRAPLVGPLLVGRGHDAQLQLTDRTVSRRHLEVTPRDEGAEFATVGDAAPFTWRGKTVRRATVGLNERLVIGDTALSVVTVAPAHTPISFDEAAREVTSVRALLNDTAVESRGLAAIFALNEALATVERLDDLEDVVARWSRHHLGGIARLTHKPAEAGALVVSAPDEVGAREISTSLGGAAGRLVVTLPHRGRPIGDELRRLIAVAAMLVGSSRARLRRLDVARADNDALRRIAIGSARSFLGQSPAADRVATLVPKLARADTTALVFGETGSGKSFLARLIHEASPRAAEPFRVINCAALPEHLVESELFGHERGAFTGAAQTRVGALDAAGRGTVLLDEIGDLPLASQAKLLRVLEERRFERLGSNRAIALEARVLAATNRDLDAMIVEGSFRRDLFFRISVVKVEVAPLRDRRDDIPLLAERFLADLAPHAGRRVDGFDVETLAILKSHGWPGNVRELRNVVEHAVVLGDGPTITPRDLPADVGRTTGPTVESPRGDHVVHLPMDLASLERHAIEAALEATDGNRTKAAGLLGINRVTLYKKLKAWSRRK